MHELVGTVERFLFQNDQTGFAVFVIAAEKQTVTVRGYAPAVQTGQQVELKGSWVVHPKFGKQFEATQCAVCAPTSIKGLKKYLGSGMIKGVGKVYAEKLVDYFGAQVLSIIEQHPERLAEVPGIGPKRAETIIHAWSEQKEVASLMVFLQGHGVSTAFATKIYKQYGNAAIARVTENPYTLAYDIWGVGFKSADQIAQNMGFAPDCLERVSAGVLFSLASDAQQGHLYSELEQLRAATHTLLELTPTKETNETLSRALHKLYDQQKLKLITHEGTHFLTTAASYFTEKSVATRLLRLLEHPARTTVDIQKAYDQLRVVEEKQIELNEAQQKGIMSCLQSKISVITGGPGTGKTTLVRKLLQLLDQAGMIYRLAAPTGRAAKRMLEGTGKYAVTLHRLLEFNPQTFSFTHDEHNALKLDFLIIDEASMIDIFLAHSLIKAMPLTGHIIFIGDTDQLPSVGAGNFLNDLIASQKIPVTRLHYIFRQAHNSLITYNAHRINAGQFPVSAMAGTIRDYEFIKLENPEHLEGLLHEIFEKKLKRYGLHHQNAVVLSPMNRGTAGTQHINHYLQSMINGAPQPEIARMGVTFKVHDRVMQIKNNYDKNAFNGDIGVIESIDHEDKKVLVKFGHTAIPYEFTELDELVLAYALSIHKSQGSEFDAVIIPLFTQHFTLLQRNLLYTGLTRAKKLCILVGQPRAIAMAVKNNKAIKRTTFLNLYLTSDLACR